MDNPSPPAETFPELLQRVHALGRDCVAPHAAEVDRDARFPAEAFAGLRAARLLSCYLPVEVGGMGLSMTEVGLICEALAAHCGSTAMIFAMHQIQVACLVHHGLAFPWFRAFARDLADRQLLLASATTELGIGGDVRRSICAVVVEGGRFTLEKQAPVISYGEAADAIMVTCRSHPEAGPSDQSIVLVRREDCELRPISGWDTLGFRGTCSQGYALRAAGSAEQVLPVPYAQVHGRTMHPVAHLLWSSLWLGIASDAVQRARAFVRAAARKTPGTLPPGALRLSEVDAELFSMRGGVHQTMDEYQRLLAGSDDSGGSLADLAFALRVNHLKVRSSELVVDVVGHAMLVCGIAGYRNDSPHSLCRHLRDAYGAAIMVNNDRILEQSSTMQIALRGQ